MLICYAQKKFSTVLLNTASEVHTFYATLIIIFAQNFRFDSLHEVGHKKLNHF